MLKRLSTIAFALSAAACGPSTPEGECPALSIGGDFSIGSGESCFTPLAASGDTVHLIAGPQGGHHLWLSVRCKSCADSFTFHYGVTDVATGMVVATEAPDGFTTVLKGRREADGYVVEPGLRAIMPDDEAMIVGKSFTLWGRVDEAGLKDERTVTVNGVETQGGGCGQCN